MLALFFLPTNPSSVLVHKNGIKNGTDFIKVIPYGTENGTKDVSVYFFSFPLIS